MRSVLAIAGAVLGVLAGATCVAAGVYLLSWRSVQAHDFGTFDATAFDVLEHGIGLYALGKGVGIWALTALALRPRANGTD